MNTSLIKTGLLELIGLDIIYQVPTFWFFFFSRCGLQFQVFTYSVSSHIKEESLEGTQTTKVCDDNEQCNDKLSMVSGVQRLSIICGVVLKT